MDGRGVWSGQRLAAKRNRAVIRIFICQVFSIVGKHCSRTWGFETQTKSYSHADVVLTLVVLKSTICDIWGRVGIICTGAYLINSKLTAGATEIVCWRFSFSSMRQTEKRFLNNSLGFTNFDILCLDTSGSRISTTLYALESCGLPANARRVKVTQSCIIKHQCHFISREKFRETSHHKQELLEQLGRQ